MVKRVKRIYVLFHTYARNKIAEKEGSMGNMDERNQQKARLFFNDIQRIVIVRALYVGDLLAAIPAIRALRQHFSQAEITLIGLPWMESFLPRFKHLIDRFVVFPGYPGIDEVPFDAGRTERFLAEQRAYRYDLAIQMHGNGYRSNAFVADLQAKITVGAFEHQKPGFLTLSTPYRHDLHEIQRTLILSQLVGCHHLDPRLECPVGEGDREEAMALLCGLAQNRPWIGLHPGSRSPSRRWLPAYFATVADEMVKRYNAQILLTGVKDEENTVLAVRDHMHETALNLVGKTSLGGMAAIIDKLDLFVCNDTGPAQIAYALDIPSITIFGPGEQFRWQALDRARHPIVQRLVSCSPCGLWTCPIDHRCLHWLTPEIVLRAAEPLLQRYDDTCSVESQQQGG
jgi:ADP-heptose:LPS heptosyltransferase